MVRRAAILVGIVVLVVGAIAFVHHVRGARFVASAQPVEVSSEACLAMVRTQGFGSSSADFICADAEGSPWFSFTVRNLGHRGAWFNHCLVQAFDSSGSVVYRTEIGFGRSGLGAGPAGPFLDPGEVFSHPWYSKTQLPRATAVRFAAECPPIDYGENEPS
jgi:hypothetical protein